MPKSKAENSVARWGGLILIAGIIGGFAVGFNIITILLMVGGILAMIVGVIMGKKKA